MYRDHSVAVVVPAYNEAEFVGEVIETMPAFVDRIYAVDDRSSDGTWNEILRYAPASSGTDRAPEAAIDTWEGNRIVVDQRPADGDGARTADDATRNADGDVSGTEDGDATRVTDTETARIADGDAARTDGGAADATSARVVPIQHARNRGVGAAITTGYRRALEDGMDVTAVMAGDGQMDPDQLDRLLDPVVEGRAAYAKGNRLLGEDDYEEMSSFRLFGNVTLSVLTKIASGYWELLDPQNGYTAISHEALETIDLDDLYEAYGFTNDLLVRLNAAGFRVADVTMPAVYGDEESHIEYRSFVPRLSWLLLHRFAYRLRVKYLVTDFHPLAAFYGLGIVGVGVTLAALGAVASAREDADSVAGAAISSVVLAVVSSACLLLAMTFDRQENDDMVVTVR